MHQEIRPPFKEAAHCIELLYALYPSTRACNHCPALRLRRRIKILKRGTKRWLSVAGVPGILATGLHIPELRVVDYTVEIVLG